MAARVVGVDRDTVKLEERSPGGSDVAAATQNLQQRRLASGHACATCDAGTAGCCTWIPSKENMWWRYRQRLCVCMWCVGVALASSHVLNMKCNAAGCKGQCWQRVNGQRHRVAAAHTCVTA